MKRFLIYLNIALVMFLYPRAVVAQSELSDEMITNPSQNFALVLENIDRLKYLIYIDDNVATHVEGYARSLHPSWARGNTKDTRTVILDNLDPGIHTVRIEAIQDRDIEKAKLREEFLFEYSPLVFDVDIDEFYITRHTIDLQNALPSRVVTHHAVEYDGIEWKTFNTEVDGRLIEVRLQQYRKKDKLGRVTQRLDARGKWDRAEKHIYYTNIDISIDGENTFSEHNVPCAGRVEYRYWDYTYGKWWDAVFLDNMIGDRQYIYQFVRTVPLTESYELRIAAYDMSVEYTIIKLENATLQASITDAE